jgi:hypothetical protein
MVQLFKNDPLTAGCYYFRFCVCKFVCLNTAIYCARVSSGCFCGAKVYRKNLLPMSESQVIESVHLFYICLQNLVY